MAGQTLIDEVRVDLTNTRVSAATGGLPGRYASALFELAVESDLLTKVESDLGQLRTALQESHEFARLTTSPVIGRTDAAAALAALADRLGLQDLTRRFLGVLAGNGRLAALPDIIAQFQVLLSAHRGAAIATVVSARPLSDRQTDQLVAKLKARTGRDITLDRRIDPALLGGLVVRIGSEQIDSSIRTRLDRLGQQMKG